MVIVFCCSNEEHQTHHEINKKKTELKKIVADHNLSLATWSCLTLSLPQLRIVCCSSIFALAKVLNCTPSKAREFRDACTIIAQRSYCMERSLSKRVP